MSEKLSHFATTQHQRLNNKRPAFSKTETKHAISST